MAPGVRDGLGSPGSRDAADVETCSPSTRAIKITAVREKVFIEQVFHLPMKCLAIDDANKKKFFRRPVCERRIKPQCVVSRT